MTLRKSPDDQTSEELRTSYKALDFFLRETFGNKINYILLIGQDGVRIMSNQTEAVVVSALKMAAHDIEHGKGYEIPTEVH